MTRCACGWNAAGNRSWDAKYRRSLHHHHHHRCRVATSNRAENWTVVSCSTFATMTAICQSIFNFSKKIPAIAFFSTKKSLGWIAILSSSSTNTRECKHPSPPSSSAQRKALIPLERLSSSDSIFARFLNNSLESFSQSVALKVFAIDGLKQGGGGGIVCELCKVETVALPVYSFSGRKQLFKRDNC